MEANGHGKVLSKRTSKLMLPPLINHLVNHNLLMLQMGLFKMCMKSNVRVTMLPPFDLNPLIKVWRVLDNNNNLTKNFSKFIKLAKIVVTHLIGLVEGERTFSSLAF